MLKSDFCIHTSILVQMINVAAFLIEHFADLQSCPNGHELGHVLEAAGFDDEAIRDTLMLMQILAESPVETFADGYSMRVYHPAEAEVLNADICGLLHTLCENRTITPAQRELVIHVLMCIPDDDMTFDHAKVILLLVLWAQRCELPVLIGDELMTALHGKGVMQ